MRDLNRYAPLETALKGAGFKVDEVENQGEKTVITVSRSWYGQKGENPVNLRNEDTLQTQDG